MDGWPAGLYIFVSLSEANSPDCVECVCVGGRDPAWQQQYVKRDGRTGGRKRRSENWERSWRDLLIYFSDHSFFLYSIAGIDTFLFFFSVFLLSRSLIDTCVQRRRALLHFLRRWRRTAVETNKQQQQQAQQLLTGFTPFCFVFFYKRKRNQQWKINCKLSGWLWDLACQSVGGKEEKGETETVRAAGAGLKLMGTDLPGLGRQEMGKDKQV